MKEKPEYVAKRSAWAVLRFWHILVFWLAIPAIIFGVMGLLKLKYLYIFIALGAWYAIVIIKLIADIIVMKSHRIEFYRHKVVEKWGVFDIEKKSNVFTAVLAVKVEQKFWERFFGYGEVKVNMVGPWDVDLTKIKKPKKLVNYLDSRIAHIRGMHQFLHN